MSDRVISPTRPSKSRISFLRFVILSVWSDLLPHGVNTHVLPGRTFFLNWVSKYLQPFDHLSTKILLPNTISIYIYLPRVDMLRLPKCQNIKMYSYVQPLINHCQNTPPNNKKITVYAYSS
jgi:hypothetical protein